MQGTREQQAQVKLSNLFELFPHVNCDQVRDIFEGVEQNIQMAAETLKAIYGEPPEDLSDQFRIIDDAGNMQELKDEQAPVVFNPEDYQYGDGDSFEVLPDNDTKSAEENKEEFQVVVKKQTKK